MKQTYDENGNISTELKEKKTNRLLNKKVDDVNKLSIEKRLKKVDNFIKNNNLSFIFKDLKDKKPLLSLPTKFTKENLEKANLCLGHIIYKSKYNGESEQQSLINSIVKPSNNHIRKNKEKQIEIEKQITEKFTSATSWMLDIPIGCVFVKDKQGILRACDYVVKINNYYYAVEAKSSSSLDSKKYVIKFIEEVLEVGNNNLKTGNNMNLKPICIVPDKLKYNEKYRQFLKTPKEFAEMCKENNCVSKTIRSPEEFSKFLYNIHKKTKNYLLPENLFSFNSKFLNRINNYYKEQEDNKQQLPVNANTNATNSSVETNYFNY